jgi:hypothetical protein
LPSKLWVCTIIRLASRVRPINHEARALVRLCIQAHALSVFKVSEGLPLCGHSLQYGEPLHIRTCTHTHAHIHTYTQTHSYTHSYTHIRTRAHTHTLTHTYPHLPTLTYIHTHTHTYTQRAWSAYKRT